MCWRVCASRRPRVHCITNSVAQNFTANVLLAAGAIPSMTVAPEEIGEFVTRADALLVNLGTFDQRAPRRHRDRHRAAVEQGRPWVLDPVFVDRSPPRTAFARTLVARNGRRPFASMERSFPHWRRRPRTTRHCATTRSDQACVIALTGATDHVTDGARLVQHRQRRSAHEPRDRHGLRRSPRWSRRRSRLKAMR